MPRFTRKQRELLQQQAKTLRDEMVQCILQWERTATTELSAACKSEAVAKTIQNSILQAAYSGLIWRTLSKAERYNTPYYQKILRELRQEHPDLEVVNGMKTFVRWPVFAKEDLDHMLSSDVEPLVLEPDDQAAETLASDRGPLPTDR